MPGTHGDPLLARTKSFAQEVISTVAQLPPSEPARIIGKKTLLAAAAVGVDYRRMTSLGAQRIIVAEQCLGQLEETAHWLELLEESGLVPDLDIKSLRLECRMLQALFGQYQNSPEAQPW